MKKNENELEMTKNDLLSSNSHLAQNKAFDISTTHLEQEIYNSIAVCTTAASFIRHNVSVIQSKLKSGKISRSEFHHYTKSIFEALNLIDNNLARTTKFFSHLQKTEIASHAYSHPLDLLYKAPTAVNKRTIHKLSKHEIIIAIWCSQKTKNTANKNNLFKIIL